MNSSIWKIILAILALAVAGSHAEGLDFFNPRSHAYFLKVPRSVSYQLLPGDYVEVAVVSGSPGRQIRKTLMKKIQVVKISNAPRDYSLLTLAMNKHELVRLKRALGQPQTVASLRVVQKQHRSEAAARTTPDDALPDLNFEHSVDMVKN